MANFPNTAETNDTTSADFYLLRQGTIDVKQNRETLAAGISNARYTALTDYDTGSNVVGSNGLNYKAVQDNGPGTGAGAVDPTTDDGTYWEPDLSQQDVEDQASGKASFYTASGTNDYNLTRGTGQEGISGLFDGLEVRFRLTTANTGPVTVDVNNLGPRNVTFKDGTTPLSGGELEGLVILVYNSTFDVFEVLDTDDTNSPFALLNYNASTNTINKSVGVSSVTDNGTGELTVNLDSARPDQFYYVVVSGSVGAGQSSFRTTILTNSTVSIATYDNSGSLADASSLSVLFFDS